MKNISFGLAAAIIFASGAHAQEDRFHDGALISDFGKVATVDGREAIPADATFKVSFDITKKAADGELNRSLNSGARFLNMHHEAGVKPENMSLALVIHGGAVKDVTNAASYKKDHEKENANTALVEKLLANGVQIYVCGQSAAYYGVDTDDLLPGVKMALSAMTAHALLQQDGYTLNPF